MSTNDPKALLNHLLQEPGEAAWLEFKQNNCAPEEIAKCICACANAAILADRPRAFIVYGIEDGTKNKVGTSVRLHKIKQGNENLSNWLARVLTPSLMIEYLDFEEDGKAFAIIAFEPTYDRPLRFKDTEYIRVGENIKLLRDLDAYQRALWLATSKRKFEAAVSLPHQSPDQVLEKLDIGAYYKLTNEEQPANPDEVLRRMESAGFIQGDLEGGYDITNLGAIVLAKDITSFSTVSGKSVRVIKYVGKTKQKSQKEIDGRRGYAVGFSGLIQFVLGELPTTEEYVKGVRKKAAVYSETAIREIIANALIHQDFTVSGTGPIVEIYDDRIEVTNPGNSLVGIPRIIDERRSRNEKLASTLRSLGICEERGGGIDKAIIEIEEKFLPAPWFLASENSMQVVLFGPKKFKDLSKEDRTWACFCHCVVRYIRHDYMNNTSLRARFSLPESEYQAVSMVIQNAKKAGHIVPADAGQGNRYAKYVPFWAR